MTFVFKRFINLFVCVFHLSVCALLAYGVQGSQRRASGTELRPFATMQGAGSITLILCRPTDAVTHQVASSAPVIRFFFKIYYLYLCLWGIFTHD